MEYIRRLLLTCREALAGRAFPVCLLIAAAAIAWQCLVPPIVGLADNGDYYVFTEPFGLQAVVRGTGEERYQGYVVTDFFDTRNPRRAQLFTTGWLTFAPGYLWTRVFSKNSHYDIRLAGVTHAALYLLALGLLFPVLLRAGPAWAMALALVVACDVQYVCYFNSLYTDVVSLVFLLLAVAFYVRLATGTGAPETNGRWFLLFVVLFIGSKAQHSILLAPAAAFVFWKRPLLFAAAGRRTTLVAIALIVVIGLVCIFWTPAEYRAIPYYTTIFKGLMPFHPNPGELLKEFDLPREFITYMANDSYMIMFTMGKPGFQKEFTERASWKRLVSYYLRTPRATWWRLRVGAVEGARQRPLLGNFTQDAGFLPWARSSAFDTWSDLKVWLFEDRSEAYLAYFAAVVGLALFAARRANQHLFHGCLTLAVMASIEFVLASLADAKETTRHLALFNTLLDLMLVGTVFAFAAKTRVPSPERGVALAGRGRRS